MADCNTAVLNALLIVGGWWVVNHLNLKRERRKEYRERAERLVSEFLRIEEQALAFHRADTYNAHDARSIQAAIDRALRLLSHRPLDQLNIELALRYKLRQAITRKNFDASAFVQQPAESELLDGIASAVEQLCTRIRQRVENVFP